MSPSYSENYLAFQNSLSLTAMYTVLWNTSLVCATAPKDLHQPPLNKEDPLGRRELENIPENIPLIILEH